METFLTDAIHSSKILIGVHRNERSTLSDP